MPDLIKQELEQINNAMSMFEENSEISGINRAGAGQWLDVSPQLYSVLQAGRQIWAQSGGAFDPTVGPLVSLWGFGPEGRGKHPPEGLIKETLLFTGMDKLRFDTAMRRIKKSDARTSLDLSAIANGYGVDRIAALLHRLGYHDFVVEIGGEVRASGNKSAANEGWIIGVAKPSAENKDNLLVLSLHDAAAATSGNYNNFYLDEKGNRVSHTISPITGYPVSNPLASVTVIADNCMSADAYATAVMSLGAEKGLEFADRNHLQAILFIKKKDGSFELRFSKAAAALKGE